MAKYIKQEVPDMKKTGEQKVFYRMKVERNIDFQEFIQQVCSHHKGITRGEALRVLVSASETLAELLGEGYSVTIDDWGTFKATIGLEEGKELDTLDGQETKRNSRSLKLKGVNFRADKELVKSARTKCDLKREGTSRIRRSPYTKAKRLEMALEYLEKHGAMRVPDYMELTGLSRTTATLELQEFRRDASSGIGFVGRGSAKVYVKRV
jgi:predicted histone-like DNA-binding protein